VLRFTPDSAPSLMIVPPRYQGIIASIAAQTVALDAVSGVIAVGQPTFGP
jgi:hypothetical protein